MPDSLKASDIEEPKQTLSASDIHQDIPEEAPSSWRKQLGDFGSHLWDMLKGAADPHNGINGAMKALDQTGTELTAAKDALKSGNYNRALYHTVRAVPVLGPLADQAQEEVSKGDVGAALGDTAGLLIANRGARAIPEAAAAIPEIPGKIADIAAKPGVRPIAAGAAEVAAAGPALYAGHPYVAGGAFLRGVQNIKAGLAARRAAAQPVAPIQEPGVTDPANVVTREPQFEEMPPAPPARPFVSPETPAPPAQPPSVITKEPQFEEMGPIPPQREFTPQPKANPVEEGVTLDAIGKSLAGKRFSALTPAQQTTARQLASRLGSKTAPVEVEPQGATALPPQAETVSNIAKPTPQEAAQALAAETGQEGTIPFSKPAYQKRDAAAGQPSVEPEGFKMLNRAERHERAVSLSNALHGAGVTAEDLAGVKTTDLPTIGKHAGVEIPATDSARRALLDEALFELRRKQRATAAAQAMADAMKPETPGSYPAISDPKTGDFKTISGLKVRTEVPNMRSIDSSIENPEELPGIREVPLSDFPATSGAYKSSNHFYAADDVARVDKLADQIKASGEINPLIVAIDEKGPYVLEGGHRLAALHKLGKKSLPAKIVIDRDAVPSDAMK